MSSLVFSSFPTVRSTVVSRIGTQAVPTCDDVIAPSAGSQPGTWVFKATGTSLEREAAFQLVYQVYHRANLIPDHPLGMRVMKQHLSDHTDVLIAKRDSEVVFTITLVRDAEYGLPLESLFASELNAMREEGHCVAEVSCLASDASLQSKTQRFELLVKMISLTLQTARRRGVDRLLLAVHPRHARVYQRLFGCVRCSEVKEYAAVQGNPAVLCMHDFAQLDVTKYPLYDQVYGPEYTPWQLDGTRMTEAEKWHYSQALSSTLVPMGA